MGSIAGDGTGVNLKAVFAGALKDAQQEMVRRVGEAVGQELDGAVKRMLGREAYERRERVAPWVEMAGVCHRCKSRQSQRFSRNGHREHRVLTLWGEVSVPVQRLVCECGGSVQLGLDGWLRPYQRVGDDVDEQIRRWGALRVSLREMQGELEQLHISPLALRTLNKRLHQIVTAANEPTPTSVPPVLQVDAIWVTQLAPTGGFHRDDKGRCRPNKQRIKRPIFIALGVWPDTDQAQVLAWRLAAKEDGNDWLDFLSDLEAAGVRGDNGLELVIHDGGAGLCAAMNIIHFGAAEQRCLFHKLRNLYHAIHISDQTLTRKEQQRQRKAIFRDFHHIWQAKQPATALRRYRQVVRLYRTSQPDAVRCLRSDFRSTLAYFHLQARHPAWSAVHLRTTSRLERFNRSIRRRTRATAAYHSDAGLTAMLHQEVSSFNSAHRQSKISTN